jgi:membrane-bound lytic murein transglycosylase B
MKRLWIAGLAVLVSGCGLLGGSDGSEPVETGAASTRSTPSPTKAQATAADAPAADAAIPKNADELAEVLGATTLDLRRAIDAWREDGEGVRGEPPQEVTLLAMYQQRIYRMLGRQPKLADQVISRLPKAAVDQARDNVGAATSLFLLTRPTSKPGRFRTQEPLTAGQLRDYMRQAERRFGVDWQVLAAVMNVETKFGRLKSPSSAGAQGPMQFMPATWRAYGMGGDVHDTRDAIMGAANYLRASGAPRNYPRALHAYNPDTRYVDAVMRYARQIRRDERNFYAYYNWQVFVLTTKGDLRLTGPQL